MAKIILSDARIHVNHQAGLRSGHMGHTMQALKSGRIIDFNANTSPYRVNGHAAYGWMEYRYSTDGGETFSEAHKLDYSWKAFMDGMFTVSAEKSVVTNTGKLILCCLRNTPYHEICCEPWLTPTYLYSTDEGETWSPPSELTPYAGRVYDARYHEGVIYALEFCNDAQVHFTGNSPEHKYRLFTSRDDGESFQELCVVPFPDTMHRGYGAMLFRPDGSLIVYAYNESDETHMDYAISYDNGVTWRETGACEVKKRIRNPQIAYLNGTYVLHGRAGAQGFVIYTSDDGIHWDDGYMTDTKKSGCYYSNNLVIGDRLLLQYSETYELMRVNVMHRWLTIAK